MATLRHRGSTLYLFSSFSERDRCKAIPGAFWNREHKAWTYPFSALEDIKTAFPGINLPETIEAYKQLKKDAETRLTVTKTHGYEDFEHEFLLKHQRLCLSISRQYKRFAFFLGTGTGKTLMSLAIVNDDKPCLRTLVVCPKKIINPSWFEDQQNFYPHLRMVCLNTEGNKSLLIKALNTDADIYIVNFETFKILFDTLPQLKLRRLIVDESSKMKDNTSQITKDLLNFGKTMEECYILSGTPAPNNELEYWAQIEIISPGLLGPSFYSFKNYYFLKNPNNQYQVFLNKDKKEELMQKISSVSIYIDQKDCLDIPEETYNIVDVEMTKEQYKIYKQMEREQFAQINENEMILTPNKLASIMKLRQITAGFIYDENKIGQFISDAKLKKLLEDIEEIGPQNSVIIWCQFREEFAMIEAALTKKYGPGLVGTVHGGTKDSDKEIADFKAGKTKWLLCHPQSAMYGLTMNIARYSIYYSMSQSYEQFHQSRDRNKRLGQKFSVNYRFLVCVNSIDKAIVTAVKKKQSVSQEIMNYIRITKGGGTYGNPDDKTQGL